MTSIEERLALLEAERDIFRALARYGHALDYGLANEWADCFTEDGVFSIQLLEPEKGFMPWARYSGRDQLRRFAETHSHAPDAYLKHFVLDSVVNVDRVTATATSYFVRMDAGPAPYLRAFGRYSDELVACADGRWRISQRRAEIESIAHGAQPHLISEVPE